MNRLYWNGLSTKHNGCNSRVCASHLFLCLLRAEEPSCVEFASMGKYCFFFRRHSIWDDTAMAEVQSTFPPPPWQYINQYTDENIKRNRAPAPPPPVQVKHRCRVLINFYLKFTFMFQSHQTPSCILSSAHREHYILSWYEWAMGVYYCNI